MPAQPTLSIVIPVYAVEEYVGACLDSIMRQAPANTEVIAVDDASPDGCGRILDARAREDPRLRVVHLTDNAGPGNARNVGLAQAAGEYVWFVDADDLLADGGLAAVADRLGQDRPDVLLIGYENLYPGGDTGPGPGLALLSAAPAGPFPLAEQPQLIHLTMTSWSKVIRRTFLAGLGVAFADGIHEDVPVSCAMLLRAERISALSRVCYRYRRARPGSFMATASSAQMRIFGSYGRVFALAAAAEPPLAREVRAALFERAIWHYTTLLPLVPREARRGYFRRMQDDFVRYRPLGYRHPPGVRGVRFWLVERNAYMIHTVLEPVNQLRLLLARAASRWPKRPSAGIKWESGSRSLRR
jgi:CDP-glycerol glycerophosphotransferase